MGFNQDQFRRRVVVTIVIATLFLMIGSILIFQYTYTRAQDQFEKLTVKHSWQLEQMIYHHEVLGAVESLGIASIQLQKIVQGVGDHNDQVLLRELEVLKRSYHGNVIYAMDLKGAVLISTEYAPGKRLTGNNYAFRYYFKEALQGKSVIYPALGVTTLARGFYYAAPIYSKQNIFGVVVIKVNFNKIDELFQHISGDFYLVSSHNQIFGTTKPDKLLQQFNSSQKLGVYTKKIMLKIGDEKGHWSFRGIANTKFWYQLYYIFFYCLLVIGITSLIVLILYQSMKRKREGYEALKHLEEKQRRYRVLFEGTSDPIILLNQDRTIFECNFAAIILFGEECFEALLNHTLLSFSPKYQGKSGASVTLLDDHFARINREEHFKFEWTFLREETSFSANISINQIYAGSSKELQLVIRDISQQKAFQANILQAKQNAEAASEAKSRFLANVSHEIRTPMNAIIGLTQLLLQDHLTPDQQENLEDIKESARTLLYLINQLLDFSKIESGIVELELEATSLEKIVNDVSHLLLLKAWGNSNEITVDFDDEIPELLVLDYMKMKQILTNLVNNGIKFTENGTIEIKCHLLSLQEEHVTINIGIRDTGIGIEPERLEEIFEPFVQADGSITRRYGGTGLGLVISRNLVELMGGELLVESTPREGSYFYFKLNIPFIKRDIDQDTSVIRILITENHKINQKLLRSFLKEDRYHLTIVDDGTSALAEINQNHFNLIFLNLSLTDISSESILAKIKDQFDGEDIPVIAMGRGIYEREKAFEMGFSSYLIKPYHYHQMMAVIKQFH